MTYRHDLPGSAMIEAAEREGQRIRDMRKMLGLDLSSSFLAASQAADSHHKMFGGLHGSTSSALAMASANIGSQVKGISGLSSVMESIMAHQPERSALGGILAGLNSVNRPDSFGISNSMHFALDAQKSAQAAYAVKELRGLYDIAESPIARMLALVSSTQKMYEGIAAGMAGSWTRALDPALLSHVQTELEEEVEEHPEANIGAVVEAAVLRAVERYDQERTKRDVRTTDPRFILALIVSMLIYFASLNDARVASQEAKELHEELVAHIDDRFNRQERLMKMMVTKTVIQGTRVWSKPSSHSPMIGPIKPGASVIKIVKKGKWTQVAIHPKDAPSGVATPGWVLNKHLSKQKKKK